MNGVRLLQECNSNETIDMLRTIKNKLNNSIICTRDEKRKSPKLRIKAKEKFREPLKRTEQKRREHKKR